jgi:hypothetical protein
VAKIFYPTVGITVWEIKTALVRLSETTRQQSEGRLRNMSQVTDPMIETQTEKRYPSRVCKPTKKTVDTRKRIRQKERQRPEKPTKEGRGTAEVDGDIPRDLALTLEEQVRREKDLVGFCPK